MFPIPKKLKSAKTTKQIEIKKPSLELAKINENRKNKKINKFRKNNIMNKENFGSAK